MLCLSENIFELYDLKKKNNIYYREIYFSTSRLINTHVSAVETKLWCSVFRQQSQKKLLSDFGAGCVLYLCSNMLLGTRNQSNFSHFWWFFGVLQHLIGELYFEKSSKDLLKSLKKKILVTLGRTGDVPSPDIEIGPFSKIWVPSSIFGIPTPSLFIHLTKITQKWFFFFIRYLQVCSNIYKKAQKHWKNRWSKKFLPFFNHFGLSRTWHK